MSSSPELWPQIAVKPPKLLPFQVGLISELLSSGTYNSYGTTCALMWSRASGYLLHVSPNLPLLSAQFLIPPTS